MWQAVTEELGQLMGAQLYKSLYHDPTYALFLRRAGIQEPFPRRYDQLSNEQKRNLVESGRMHASLMVADLVKGDSLRERRAKAVLVSGPLTMYRLWSNKSSNRLSYWWFSQGLMDEARVAGGPAEQMAWLRDRLAVAMDWSDCDRIAVMQLGPEDEIPAVEAWGLPMRVYSYSVDYKTGTWRNTATSNKEYYDNLHRKFQGQKTQTYLAWTPARRVSDYY